VTLRGVNYQTSTTRNQNPQTLGKTLFSGISIGVLYYFSWLGIFKAVPTYDSHCCRISKWIENYSIVSFLELGMKGTKLKNLILGG
jgi:hypothetical protein